MASSPFIESQKTLYGQLNPCFCPSIQETIHFNAEGLRHLLYEDNRPRNIKVKEYRMALVQYLVHAIATATKARKQTFTDPIYSLWVLEWIEVSDKKKGKLKIKIILRKKGINGNVHFLSVMSKGNNKKSSKKTKKPKQ